MLLSTYTNLKECNVYMYIEKNTSASSYLKKKIVKTTELMFSLAAAITDFWRMYKLK